MIVETIHRYHPDWDPPADTGRDWIPCLCPFHGEANKSASVSYNRNAFRCHGCGVKGDHYAIIRQQEGVTFEEAVQLAAEISPGSSGPLPSGDSRKRRRRVFAEEGPVPGQRQGRSIPAGIRSRPTPW